MSSGDARLALVGRAMQGIVGWARRLDSHRSFPFCDLDLTRAQVEVLFLVAHSGEQVTPGRLATELGVTPGAVTQLVSGLLAGGLLVQERDPADARRRVLVLSERARASVAELEHDVVLEFASRFSTLSDDELETLATLLARTADE